MYEESDAHYTMGNKNASQTCNVNRTLVGNKIVTQM